jgi:hypothetical protein
MNMKFLRSPKTLLAVTTLGLMVVGIGTLAANAQTNNSDTVRTAIQNRDLTAFKKAVVDRAQYHADSTTQDDLNKRADNLAKHEAVKTAIDNNDYEAFKSNADPRMLAKVNSQEAFTKLVESSKQMKAIQDKVDQAVKDNNFDAFKAAKTEMKALRDAEEAQEPADSSDKRNSNRAAPTEAEMKTRFDKLVAQYKADGSLPSTRGIGHGFGDDFDGHRGGKGHGRGGM